jgi:hypothetical protein
MDKIEFEKLTRRYFQFLEDEFHFTCQQMDHQYTEIFFISRITGIRIVLDKGTVELQMGHIADPPSEWYEFIDIMRYFAPNIMDVDKFVPTLTTELVENQLNQMALWCFL